MADTLKAQHIAHLTTGCVCYSDMGRILCSITADTCGWHDPLCGLTDAAQIAARYGATRFQEQRNATLSSAGATPCWWSSASTASASATSSPTSIFSARSWSTRRAHCSSPRATAKAGQYVDLRFEMDTIVALHAGPHPLATGTKYAPPAIRLQARRGIAARRRRSLPHSLPGKRARLHQHRKDVFSLSTATSSTRWCPRVNRGWVSCARGQSFRIVDLEGNQAVDTLFYNAADTAEHYSAQNTIQAQGRIYLTTGTVLLSNRGNADVAHRGRHLRAARHAGRRLFGREQHRALRAREASHAQLPRQLPAGAGASRARRPHQARPALEHQFLHERAGDARRASCASPTASRRPAGTCRCARSWTRWC